MEAVMNETMRLYGASNFSTVRDINDDVQLGGIQLPKGSVIGVQSVTIHHSEQYYDKPYEFIPERWLNRKSEQPFSFISFGGGQRNCIGQHLARIEYKMILSKLLRKYKIRTEKPF